MNPELNYEIVRNFSIALLIGCLIGIEREKHKKHSVEIGGLRTFMIFSQLGAVSAWISLQLSSPVIFAVSLLMVGMVITVGYLQASKLEPSSAGLTTELSAALTFLLGGMTILGDVELAVALAIVTSALLAFKQPLHGLVERIGMSEIYAGLKLLIASFIILPLTPNRTIDPWHSINPYQLWLLVILISGLSFAGYIANRFVGARRGILLTAFTGALASSTAVTLSFAKRSSEKHLQGKGIEYLGGILAAWLVMFVRILIEVVIVNKSILQKVIMPIGAMSLLTLLCLIWATKKVSQVGAEDKVDKEIALQNPFSLSEAIKFALFFGLILLLVGYMKNNYSTQGAYLLAALAGLTDVDAITLSMAESAKNEAFRNTATLSIIVASASNTALKTFLVMWFGGRGLRIPLAIITAAILSVGAIVSFRTLLA